MSSWSRLRTTFYAVIGRMLMYEFRYEDDDEDERIAAFMLPFTNQCRKLEQIFKDFPDLTAADIQACLAYAADRERLQFTLAA